MPERHERPRSRRPVPPLVGDLFAESVRFDRIALAHSFSGASCPESARIMKCLCALSNTRGNAMTVRRLFLAFSLVVLLSGAAILARQLEGAGGRMATAADRFVGSLDADQKKKATFGFDDKERLHWWFTPQQAKRKALRKGLPLSEMTEKQRQSGARVAQDRRQRGRVQKGLHHHQSGGPPG